MPKTLNERVGIARHQRGRQVYLREFGDKMLSILYHKMDKGQFGTLNKEGVYRYRLSRLRRMWHVEPEELAEYMRKELARELKSPKLRVYLISDRRTYICEELVLDVLGLVRSVEDLFCDNEYQVTPRTPAGQKEWEEYRQDMAPRSPVYVPPDSPLSYSPVSPAYTPTSPAWH